jgi:O-6-methylguanine DNA methyltransferase
MLFATYSTKWGIGAVVFSEKGLKRVLFPNDNVNNLEEELYGYYGKLKHDNAGLETCHLLEKYFSGNQVRFAEKIDFSDRTQFQITVYDNLKAIPYGNVTTYKALAELSGSPRAARAVGNAMRNNSLPIVVPCHRVLTSDGRIGGWSGKPGWKERLLEIEGISN